MCAADVKRVLYFQHTTSIAVTVPSRNVATLYESRLIWLNNAHTFVFPQELLVSRVLHWE